MKSKYQRRNKFGDDALHETPGAQVYLRSGLSSDKARAWCVSEGDCGSGCYQLCDCEVPCYQIPNVQMRSAIGDVQMVSADSPVGCMALVRGPHCACVKNPDR